MTLIQVNHTAHEGGRGDVRGGQHSSLLFQESPQKGAWFEEGRGKKRLHIDSFQSNQDESERLLIICPWQTLFMVAGWREGHGREKGG